MDRLISIPGFDIWENNLIGGLQSRWLKDPICFYYLLMQHVNVLPHISDAIIFSLNNWNSTEKQPVESL